MTMANIDSSIAFKSSGEIGSPLLRFLSSLKVMMLFCFKIEYRWPVKFLQVSSPLKLKKTSFFHLRLEEREEDGVFSSMKANLNLQVNLESQYGIIDTHQNFIHLDFKYK